MDYDKGKKLNKVLTAEITGHFGGPVHNKIGMYEYLMENGDIVYHLPGEFWSWVDTDTDEEMVYCPVNVKTFFKEI